MQQARRGAGGSSSTPLHRSDSEEELTERASEAAKQNRRTIGRRPHQSTDGPLPTTPSSDLGETPSSRHYAAMVARYERRENRTETIPFTPTRKGASNHTGDLTLNSISKEGLPYAIEAPSTPSRRTGTGPVIKPESTLEIVSASPGESESSLGRSVASARVVEPASSQRIGMESPNMATITSPQMSGTTSGVPGMSTDIVTATVLPTGKSETIPFGLRQTSNSYHSSAPIDRTVVTAMDPVPSIPIDEAMPHRMDETTSSEVDESSFEYRLRIARSKYLLHRSEIALLDNEEVEPEKSTEAAVNGTSETIYSESNERLSQHRLRKSSGRSQLQSDNTPRDDERLEPEQFTATAIDQKSETSHHKVREISIGRRLRNAVSYRQLPRNGILPRETTEVEPEDSTDANPKKSLKEIAQNAKDKVKTIFGRKKKAEQDKESEAEPNRQEKKKQNLRKSDSAVSIRE